MKTEINRKAKQKGLFLRTGPFPSAGKVVQYTRTGEGRRYSEYNRKGMKDMLERYLKNKTVMSVAGIIIGVILMIWRGSFVESMIRVMGYVLLAAAAVYLVMYFKDNKGDQTQLGYAVVCGGAGLLMIFLCRTILRAFPVIAGVLMILSGVATLAQVIKEKDVPLLSKILPIVVVILGILILTQPGRIANAIVFCVGVVFVVNGISGLLANREIYKAMK